MTTEALESQLKSGTKGKIAVLFIGEILVAHQEWQDLCGLADGKQIEFNTQDQFRELLQTEELANVIVIVRTFESTEVTGRFNEATLKILPRSVQYICQIGAGYDSIDIPSCTARGIRVSNTPGVNHKSTADLTMWHIIGCLRKIHVPCSAVRKGEWRGKMELGHDPDGKTLGIIGMGQIGRELAKRADAFGMDVQYHNRTKLSLAMNPLNAKYVDLEELLRTSDVISVLLPLSKSTHHMIDTDQIKMMKKGSVLINTARGPILNESAVEDAVNGDHLSSVGLDVFEDEPNISESLRQNADCILTPHMSPLTLQTMKKMEVLALDNAREALTCGRLKTEVTERKIMDE